MGLLEEITGKVLLFGLVFGMSATVDIDNLKSQIGNKSAILVGCGLQFFFLPFVGFLIVKTAGLDHAMAVTLLVLTSSPGGSYSNWWCSLFNADLALSVCMTAISTFASLFMLPLNLLVYAKYSLGDDVLSSLDWGGLFTALVIVISAICIGLYFSSQRSTPEFHMFANKIGNAAGILLVAFSMIITSTEEESELFGRGWGFYFGVATPCVAGILFSTGLTTALDLHKPERITVAIECCYQNTGIATSVAMTMFEGKDLADAVGVPLYYGLVETLLLGAYCVIAWKSGWTKAPIDEKFSKILSTSYEITKHDDFEDSNSQTGYDNMDNDDKKSPPVIQVV